MISRVTDRLWTAIDYPEMAPERARQLARVITRRSGPPLETSSPYLATCLQRPSPVITGVGIGLGLAAVGLTLAAIAQLASRRG